MKNLSKSKIVTVAKARCSLTESGATLRSGRKELVALCYDWLLEEKSPAERNNRLILVAKLMAENKLYAMAVPFHADKPCTHAKLRWSIMRLAWREWQGRELAKPRDRRDPLMQEPAWMQWSMWARREGWNISRRHFETPSK